MDLLSKIRPFRVMKTLGLIGGTGPESTIEYYRLLTAQYREKASGNSPL